MLQEQYTESDSEISDYTLILENNIICNGHELENVPAVEATYNEQGHIEYWTCINCNKWFSDEEGKTEITDKTTM